jgi:hypothetical protein
MASEFLTAFVTLFDQKADEDIKNQQEKISKKQVQVDKYNELYPALLSEAESLGVPEDFKKFFPEGGGSNIGNRLTGVDPGYVSLIQIDDEFGKNVKSLEKISKSPQALVSLNEALAFKQELKDKGGEEYLKTLSQAIKSIASSSSVTGATGADKMIDSILANPGAYNGVVELEIDLEGPRGVKTSPEAYAALKEMYDSGEMTSKGEGQAGESSAINPVEEAESPEIEEASSELAEPIKEEENVATTTVASTSSALSLPEEQKEAVPAGSVNQPLETETTSPSSVNQPLETETASPSPINQPLETEEPPVEKTEETLSQSSALNIPEQTNIENATIANEEISNNFISNIIGDTNLGNISENLTTAINSVSNPQDILNNAISGDTINNVKGGLSSFLDVSNISKGGNVANEIANVLNKEESLNSMNKLFNPTSIESNVENTENNISNQENTEKSSNFSSFPTSEIVKPEPVTKEDISKVGESISTGIGSKLAIPDLSNQGEMEGPSKREVRQAEQQERKEERKEEKQGGSGTYVEGINTSSLEKRLKNIELLLQGPLEVKIKN